MKKFLVIFSVLVVLAAATLFSITSLNPVKRNGIAQGPPNFASPPQSAVAARQSPVKSQPTLSPGPSPSANQTRDTALAVPSPSVTTNASLPPLMAEKSGSPSSKLGTESSPPLVASANTPSPGNGANVAIKPAAEQAAAYNNAEAANFEPTTLTVVRTFVLTMPDGTPVEESVSIPVLYRKGSIALKPDQLDELGAIKSELQRILEANEELRVAADLLIAKQRKVMAGSVPVEVLSTRSASVLPEGLTAPGAKYVNVPQGQVEIAPAPPGHEN